MLQHLLPNARAWNITVDKPLRRFMQGLSTIGSDAKDFTDSVYDDISPATTRELDAWENHFALPPVAGFTEAQRRDRLDGRWKALGDQDPRYLQDTLQAAGFDLYIHEWWTPGDEPAPNVKACVTPRDPRLYLRLEYTSLSVIFNAACGIDTTCCGHEEAYCYNVTEPLGYPLVNKLLRTVPKWEAMCLIDTACCAHKEAYCGNFSGYKNVPRNYTVPDDPAKWPYFIYLGGATFPDVVEIPTTRRDELETLVLTVCPAHLWVGMLVTYN